MELEVEYKNKIFIINILETEVIDDSFDHEFGTEIVRWSKITDYEIWERPEDDDDKKVQLIPEIENKIINLAEEKYNEWFKLY